MMTRSKTLTRHDDDQVEDNKHKLDLECNKDQRYLEEEHKHVLDLNEEEQHHKQM